MSEVLFKPASKKQEMFIQSKAFLTVFGGAAGSGKAQPMYSKVLTDNGWKTMGEVSVGDFVITPKNIKAKVLNTYYHKDKDIYEITTKSGVKVRACNEHLWQVNVSKPKYKSSIEVCDTDKIIEYMNQGRHVYLPVCDPIGHYNDIELPIDPYVLGVLISEGGLSSGQPIFTNADKELVDRVESWVNSQGYVLSPTKDSITFRIKKEGFERNAINEKGHLVKENEITIKLEDLGLSGKRSYDKFIPEDYLHKASINQRLELLKGLMDGDGTISETLTCEYSTSSEKLKDDFCYLVRSLGGIAYVSARYPTYTYKGEKLKGALSYRIFVRMKDIKDLFYISRKKNKARKRNQVVQDEIVDIKYIGQEDAKCIYIDDQDHLYITDDFAVTHNTFLSLMRFLFWVEDPNFIGYVFRKNATDLKGGGGAFREAVKMFKAYDSRVKYTKQPMCIYFPSGATINFTGLDGESGMNAIQGIQISAAMLDEATHFTEEEVMWIISRLRTSADMQPCLWLTCNPDPSSFLCKWLEPFYLLPKNTVENGEDIGGRPNPERDGVTRYYLRVGNAMVWGNSSQELIDEHGSKYPVDLNGITTCKPRTFSFISATCLDNPPLLKANPDYVSSLASLPRVTKERLLMGNWYAREENSGYFKRDWVEIVDDCHVKIKRMVRCWDIAATKPTESNPHPDYTASVQMGKGEDGYIYIFDARRDRIGILEVVDWIRDTAIEDREYSISRTETFIPQDPNAQAKYATQQWVMKLASDGIAVRISKSSPHNSKLDKFLPFCAVAEAGMVRVVRGSWNDMLLDELESFTGKRSTAYVKDDLVDTVSDGFSKLATNKELPSFDATLLRM